MGLTELVPNISSAIFLVFLILTLGGMTIFTKDVYDSVLIKWERCPPGYELPRMADFTVTVAASLVFAALEYLFKHILYVIFIPWCKEQNNLKERENRSKKGCFSIYRTIYFIFAVAWGYIVLKDQDYLPPSLGGSGDISNAWKNYEFPTHAPGMKMYTLVTMGYHVGGLISHFMHPKGNDFLEMALHHFCAFYLFFGYYMANCWEIGMVIAFLHDIADIFANITKWGSNTRWTKVTVFFFLINMAVWFHTRLIVLPY